VAEELRALGADTVLLVVDMQRMFAEATEWQVPGFGRLIGPVLALHGAHPEATVFTRFMTPRTPAEAEGEWSRYYERWRAMTQDRMDPSMLDLVPELARCIPPGEVVEKRSYGGFDEPGFLQALRRREASALVLTGVETEVCVLSVAIQAMDRGWRVVVVEDAVASSAKEGHEAAHGLFRGRFGCQIDIAPASDVLKAWPSGRRRRGSGRGAADSRGRATGPGEPVARRWSVGRDR
jgi:nicotinamidase-related amidase